MAWKKPKWVQQAQKAAENVVKPITTAAPVKQVQATAQKAANTVAKEVGHVVNPVAGEIALRAKNLANSEAVKKAGNAVGEGLRDFDKSVVQPVATSNAMKAIQGKAQQGADYLNKEVSTAINAIPKTAPLKSENTNFEPMPYFTKILPNAIGDTVRGTGRAALGVLTADADKIASGAKMVGSGAWNATKHGVMGALPFFNSATTTTEPTMGGGRSGGSAVAEIPKPGEDTDDVMPSGKPGRNDQAPSKISVPPVPNDGRPIPPVVTSGGSYLTGQQNKSKLASMKLPKKIRRR